MSEARGSRGKEKKDLGAFGKEGAGKKVEEEGNKVGIKGRGWGRSWGTQERKTLVPQLTFFPASIFETDERLKRFFLPLPTTSLLSFFLFLRSIRRDSPLDFSVSGLERRRGGEGNT